MSTVTTVDGTEVEFDPLTVGFVEEYSGRGIVRIELPFGRNVYTYGSLTEIVKRYELDKNMLVVQI